MELEKYKSIEEKKEIFKNHQQIKHVDDFMAWYKQIKNKHHLFRGIKEASYKNYTSVQRACITNDFVNMMPWFLVYKQVQKLKEEKEKLFEKYCKSIGITCTDFFIMSYAQHYANGISPLLDVTTNLDTALFFMCHESYLPVDGADSNAISNYASIYTLSKPMKNFQQIINDLSDRINFPNGIDKRLFNYFAKDNYRKLFSVEIFRILAGSEPFLIKNEPHMCKFSRQGYVYQNSLVVGNLNLTAQDGSFIYYDNDLNPYEENLECADIHKSLIPFITQNILIPKMKTKDYLFPNVDNIVNEAFINTLADKDILADFSHNYK